MCVVSVAPDFHIPGIHSPLPQSFSQIPLQSESHSGKKTINLRVN